MIFDKISNIDFYNEIPEYAKDFIKNLAFDLECNRYNLSETDYVNIEEYYTKNHTDCFFESHEKYADIQIVIDGIERLDYADSEKLVSKVLYDTSKDIVFYENNTHELCSLTLDGSNFVMLFPNEAHRPQMNNSAKSVKVKKAVLKIRM